MALTVDKLLASSMQQLAAEKARDHLGTEKHSVFLRGITDGSVAGSTNDAVFRFDAGNDAVEGDAMSVSHDSTDGDSVTITKKGVYEVELRFSQDQSSTVLLGVSADAEAAALTGDPAMSQDGMLDVGGATLPASTSAYHKLTTTVYVDEAEAEAGKVVRFHGTDGSDAVVPDASIDVNTDCYARITRVGDLLA